jgi:O-antigen/teichoic acid export membrane protein
MSLTRKIVLNTAVNLAGQGASYLLGAVSMILTMRYLGPETFGSYGLVLVYVGIVSGLAELGGQIILVREINQRPEESSKIIGNFILLKAALYLLAFVLGLGATWLMGYKGDMRFLLVLGLTAMLISFPVSVGAVFQARLKMWFSVAINFSAKLLALSAVLLMIWLKRGLELMLWGNIVIALMSAVVYWVLIHKWEKPDYHPDRSLILDLLSQSLPIGVLLLVGGLVLRSDVLLLSKMSDPLSLGLYTAAYKYVEWGLLVVTGLLISHLPVFSQYLKSEPEKVRRLFRVSFEIIGLFLIPASIFVGLNAAELIRLVSGPLYVEGSLALAVLIWVVLLNVWNTMAVNILIAGHKMKELLYLYFPVMAINIIVNYIGIPRFGFKVCAVSSVLSEILAVVPLFMMMKKWYGLSPAWLNTIKQLLLSIVAAIPILLFPAASIIARAGVYIIAWLALGVIIKVLDIDRLKDIYNKTRGQTC